MLHHKASCHVVLKKEMTYKIYLITNSILHNRRIDTFIGIYIRVCVFLVTKVHGYGCLQIEELPEEIVKAVLEFAVIPREQ